MLRFVFVSVLLLVPFVTYSFAEPLLPDALLAEYRHAGRALAEGQAPSEIVERLKKAIDEHSQSPYQGISQQLIRDIETSQEKAKARERAGRTLEVHPAEFLSETRMPLYLVAYPQNWDRALPEFLKTHPRDPATLVLAKGRGMIAELIPMLDDDSPTRTYDEDLLRGPPHVSRVRDSALHLIEKLSGCKFHFNATSGTPFHALTEGARRPVIQHIENWWNETKGLSPAAAIRAQLPNGDFYAQTTMAENLIRVVGDSSPEDRAFGLETLKTLARTRADYLGAHAARVLEKYGDLSPVDWYYNELKQSLNVRGRHYDGVMPALWYLSDHGGRREWELLRDVALKDQASRGNNAYVLGSLINGKSTQQSPYAIPILGLALRRTKVSGSRYVNEKIGSQSFSTADQATEYLQELTKQEFGYRREGTALERADAIAKAQTWWDKEGVTKFTFENIELTLANGTRP